MRLSIALKTLGGQFQKLPTAVHCHRLLSLETTLSKAKRFDSNDLMDWGKMQVSLKKKSIVKGNFQYYIIFHT